MDPITLAITTALANLGGKVINDAYQALKIALQHKYGIDSDLFEALENLEKKPISDGRRAILQEEVAAAKADQDPEILKMAQTLIDKVDALESYSGNSTIIKQRAGDNAIQIGTVGGDANIKK